MYNGLIAFCLLAPLVTLSATTQYDLARYQVIIDRKPFGETPEPPEPSPVMPPATETFARSLRLSMIVESDDGSITVGVVDERTNKHYVFSKGESEDGIELVDADYQLEEAVLRSDGVTTKVRIDKSISSVVSPDESLQITANNTINSEQNVGLDPAATPPLVPAPSGSNIASKDPIQKTDDRFERDIHRSGKESFLFRKNGRNQREAMERLAMEQRHARERSPAMMNNDYDERRTGDRRDRFNRGRPQYPPGNHSIRDGFARMGEHQEARQDPVPESEDQQ